MQGWKEQTDQNSQYPFVKSIAINCSGVSCKYQAMLGKHKKSNSLQICDTSQVSLPTENLL